ncbi:MAG: hypothetical protein B7X35_00780 [Halothiobacillus sp. 14-56-357]|jgi:hypothetical protein|uniref:DUF2076 domain-containing protein n=1 Tax=Halothiobacillus sp. 15-55-196 TaxID=1970382 RepID=UPI000BC61C38|nr:DUF2076 domain-containing protein [Halothiobacillus sp. 15-55-196]OZB35946.1 MAG: hypothetical protein B7X44_07975 [Halothiobacillus sp. 15-55-196]OZB57520.1 MAG: hypothetical protein B7X35_00780 [Halothiobacillus sp. 14-56-357]OZB79370.1 MAG: hypothetical protein B7X29_01190 [Halothiobacillus sp. 13-55-115]
MNTQEYALLTDLLNKLKEATPGAATAKDPEADRLIKDTLATTPDAAYLLVQRHLLLEMALERAQAELKAIQAKDSGSFLGGSTGYAADSRLAQTNAYGQPIGRAEPAATTTSQAATATTRPAFGGGSFLGTAAATATGVLGGALLFQGIEHLMGGGLGGSALAGNQPVEDVTNITENVYDSSPDTGADANAGGWDNSGMTDNSSAFDDPMADPIDPMQADSSGMFDQDDAGGGFFDGLFGGGDDDWV